MYSSKISRQKAWKCSLCTFENKNSFDRCQICSHQKNTDSEEHPIIKHMKQVQKNGFKCHRCQFVNEKLWKNCLSCNQVMIPDGSQDQIDPTDKNRVIKEQENLLQCIHCKQKNDIKNNVCVFCDSVLTEIKVDKTQKTNKSKKSRMNNKCIYCRTKFKNEVQAEAHEENCQKMSKRQLQKKVNQLTVDKCCLCYQEIVDVDGHNKVCEARKSLFSKQNPSYERMTEIQLKAILYMHEKSQKLHQLATKNLIDRIKKMGFKETDLQNLHHYITNYAPIIIHVNLSVLIQKFIADTHYRNCFQIHNVHNAARVSWQNRMFDKIYDKSTTPYQRVKYGTMNFTNDPKGVRTCQGYGNCYFLLKESVRNRCTITDMDSAGPKSSIGTLHFCYHILNKITNEEIKSAFKASKATQTNSQVIKVYKQIQIHGPVQFSKDIQRVYVNDQCFKTNPKFRELLDKFCAKNKLQHEIFKGSKWNFGTNSFQ